MICQNCGSKNPNDSVFCVSCGQKIVTQDNNKSKVNKVLLISLIIVSVIALGAIATSVIYIIKANNLNQQYTSLQSAYDELNKKYLNVESDYDEMWGALLNVCYVEEGDNTFHKYNCPIHPFKSMKRYYIYNCENAYEQGYRPCDECGTYFKILLNQR